MLKKPQLRLPLVISHILSLLYLLLSSNQSLVKIIREHRHYHHFLEILMQVFEMVGQKQSHKQSVAQVPACMHTLTKCLYL